MHERFHKQAFSASTFHPRHPRHINSPQSMLLMQQQQEAQAAFLAVPVKSRQDQLNSPMDLQLQQQQMMAELLRTRQEATNESYQETVSTVGQFVVVPSVASQGNTATTTEQ
ncbi:hypothetical protein O3P69_004099 [Scylla paramamosain]|uniref:Uncharacterized protein n=1 Tax=Scylla paramamosain TaxID=85552 RepID=A0AAW0UGK1_SCYPA